MARADLRCLWLPVPREHGCARGAVAQRHRSVPTRPLKNSKLTRQGAARLFALQLEGDAVSPRPQRLPLSLLGPSLLAADIPFPCRAEVVLGNIIKKKGWR